MVVPRPYPTLRACITPPGSPPTPNLSIPVGCGTTHGPLALLMKAGKGPVPAVALIASLDTPSSLRTASPPLALLANPSHDHQREQFTFQI